MSYENQHQGIQALGILYLLFIIGCLAFFFGGICALLCCCNQKFRGIQRKGYVVRDADLSAPLMVPTVQGAGVQIAPYPAGPPAPYPGPPTAPGWVAPGYPPVDPPPKY